MAGFRRALDVLYCTVLFSCLSYVGGAVIAMADVFKFESIVSMDEMRETLTREIPLRTDRSAVRRRFVEQGAARIWEHPVRPNIEKYVYDINLCDFYVWRWNISANYDADGELTQIYLNGEPLHVDGDALRDAKTEATPGGKQALLKVKRPRPEARKGESEIAFILYDLDTSTDSVDDEFVMGAGPSRADPGKMGKMHVYRGLERWRSIFDQEPAHAVVPYEGQCPVAGSD